jgi:GNAT superfamily N-acetyltransferase
VPEPDQRIRIRSREAADIGLCVQALAAVHQTSGYPTNWPADLIRWLTPPGTLHAWVATTNEMPIAGHVSLRHLPVTGRSKRTAELSRFFVIPAARRQGVEVALLRETMHWAAAHELDLVLDVADPLRPARALYERMEFRLVETRRAEWTTPDGQPVTLHRYAWSRQTGKR